MLGRYTIEPIEPSQIVIPAGSNLYVITYEENIHS